MRSQPACWLLASTLALAGCSAAPETGDVNAAKPGEIGLGIDLGSSGIQSVDYVITGSAGFTKLGSVDVSKSSKVATRIGALPAGTGYTITLSADATDPPSTCSGSAGFDVTAGETTPVDLTLQCVEINADLNTCPVIDGLSALPNQVALGGVITLSAEVRDPDSGPLPITYDWSTTAGVLAGSSPTATLTCSTTGSATVTLTVGDGGSDCASSESVTVTCGEASDVVEAHQVPVPTPFGVLLATQLLALGVYVGSRTRKRAG